MIEGAKAFLVGSLILLALGSSGQTQVPRAAHVVSQDGYTLPDPTLTPGVVALTDARKICGIAWGRDARHVTAAMKKMVCRLYGAPACPGPKWEIDHLVSRELGGADDVKNLWPQPIQEARLKDRVENWLHRQVCGGALPLGVAQHRIRTDWGAVYKEQFGK